MNDRNKSGATRGGSGTNRPASAVRTQDFVRGVIAEMRRVTWPTRDEWVSATILTIVLVVAIGAYTYVIDLLFGNLFTLLRPF
ncbi:MAG: preprotein translocase subunit SecE [Vulcanimicrobiaceae bacterium]